MPFLHRILTASLLPLFAGLAAAQSILIVDPNGPYTSIQDAIDAAVAGDTVLVSPGTWTETIDFLGKEISVLAAGPGGPEAHVIDGGGDLLPPCTFGLPQCGTGAVVTFASGEGPATLLEGFTVTGGVGFTPSALGGTGGILVANGSPTIRDCHVVGNRGGDGYHWTSSTTASGVGGHGGMVVTGGVPRIEACEFRDNVGGDGVHLGLGDNYDLHGGVGGLLVASEGVEVIACLFRDNAGGLGVSDAPFGPPPPPEHGSGAMWIRSSGTRVLDCTFEGNAAPGAMPGAIRVVDGTGTLPSAFSTVVAGCDFVANVGGALQVEDVRYGETRVERCRLIGNTGRTVKVSIDGSTIPGASARFEVTDSTFLGNSGGAAVYQDVALLFGAPPLHVSGCTIVAHDPGPNDAVIHGGYSSGGGPGGPAVCDGGGIAVSSSILWGNQGLPVGGFADCQVIEHSCVEGGWSGAGNIDADPLFVQTPDPGADGAWGTADDLGDLRLAGGSPCIDAGANPLGLLSVPGVDLDGHLRFRDEPGTADTGVAGGLGGAAVVDMGAYEHGSTATPWADLGPVSPPTPWPSPFGPSTFGNVALTGHGELGAGDPTAVRIQLPVAEAGRLCYLVVGGTELGQPWFDGVLVPTPNLVLALVTDPDGAAQHDFAFPPSATSGASYYVQGWVDVSETVPSFTGTNAVLAVVP